MYQSYKGLDSVFLGPEDGFRSLYNWAKFSKDGSRTKLTNSTKNSLIAAFKFYFSQSISTSSLIKQIDKTLQMIEQNLTLYLSPKG